MSERAKDKIYSRVEKDLKPTFWSLAWRIILSYLLGGFISLLFCGQFGFALSEIAQRSNNFIHQNMGEIYCSMICGSIFSLTPIIFLRLLSSRFLFKRIVNSYSFFRAVLLIFFGTFLFSHATLMNELSYLSIWVLSALVTNMSFGRLLRYISTFLNKYHFA